MTPHPQYKGIALYSVVQDEDGYISNVPLCLCEHCDVNQFLCTKHISTATERDKALDVGEILESLCKTDLYWYNKGVTEGEDVSKCRGKDCNYCGRYNAELRSKEEQG